MNKTMIFSIVTLAAGALIGGGGIGFYAMTQLEDAKAAAKAAQDEAQAALAKAKAAADKLQSDKADLSKQVDDLQALLHKARADELAATAAHASHEAEADTVDMEQLLSSLAAPAEPGDEKDPAKQEKKRERQAEKERREQFRQRAEEVAKQYRDFLDSEIAAATDPAAQQRLTQIGAQLDTMNELREKMRAAKTDEERNAVREEMRANREASQQLVRDQQKYVMQQFAARNGFTEAEQDRFLLDLKNTVDNPLFRFGGGGRYGRGARGDGPPPPQPGN